ncbi:hypothetical protein NBH00_05240 [Paraconexibacter antarcticus]|uniref:Uncharacterized protein n=1 Tax=Paraconexibacter antarcticus TaxID=2949664 RepID=A0ABY5DUB3_9ACTN|nr:hypothetical protein [Paraconexibacter antarcticus]UTI65615.1 hypothetical protein NBH00_05240 [Paraconexibacter antarcticus]
MTDLSAASKIRLSAPPTACASCFGQYPERRHVDFGAAYDGPTVEGDSPLAGVTTVAIDDLIICEECLCAAAALLGLRDDGETATEVERLTAQVDDLRARNLGALDYIRRVDEEIAERAKLEELFRPKEEPVEEEKPQRRPTKRTAA